MSIITSIILGIVQGATEFLPVSSSGHLIIMSHLLGSKSSFEFDVLVNFGTLATIIIYYRKRLLSIAQDVFVRRDLRLILKLILATIPAACIGFFGQSIIETYLHTTWVVVFMLLAVGVLMVASRWWKPSESLAINKDLHGVTFRQSLLIGFAQCFSLISGGSRSGITILTGLKLGFTTQKAAEWSFLMGIPIIFGASMKVLFSEKGMAFVTEQTGAFIIANIVSFITGMLAIHLLMRLLQQKGLYWFGWYRIALAFVLVILLSAKILS